MHGPRLCLFFSHDFKGFERLTQLATSSFIREEWGTMQRRYFVRQKEIKIEEIEGVVAVRADPQAPIDAQRQLEVLRAPLPVDNVDTAALKPFERANWRFITRNEATRSALATHRAVEGSDA